MREEEPARGAAPHAGTGTLIGPRTLIGLGVLLSAIAGYVDAIAFIELGGFYASFMSGASVSLGVSASGEQWGEVYHALFLIAAFLGGATVATVMAGITGVWALPTVLLLEGGLLTAGALLIRAGWAVSVAILPVVAAMGVQNTAMRPVNGIRLGVTFITGTLVSFGQQVGEALLGRARPWRWSGHALVWCAFTAGAALGAAVYLAFGFTALSGPAVFVVLMAALVAIAVFILRRRAHPSPSMEGRTG